MGKTVRYDVHSNKQRDGRLSRNKGTPKEWTYTKKDKTPIEEDGEVGIELFYAYLEEKSNF